MSMLHIAAEETTKLLPFSSVVFPIIALAVFALLGFVSWSFRDVANRHSHKTDGAAPHGPGH